MATPLHGSGNRLQPLQLTIIGVPALAYGSDMVFIQMIIGYVIASFFLMKIFEKAGVQGKWRAWVPVYNGLIFAKLGDLSPWAMLIAIGFGLEAVEYEPEQFPGLVYRADELDVVVLLFGSGKLVITGGSKPTDAEDAITTVHSRLDDLGLLN